MLSGKYAYGNDVLFWFFYQISWPNQLINIQIKLMFIFFITNSAMNKQF